MRGESARRTPASGFAPARGCRELRGRRGRERAAGAPRIRAGHRRQERRAVLERARHRAGVIEARRERDDAAQRDEPARRLDRRGAAQRRGDAQRAGRVRPRRGGHHARRERCRRAAARPAGRALERPRVADLVGRAADRELVRVEVAEQHHALRAQPSPDVAVRDRPLVEEPARRRQRLARDGVEILEPDRDAAQPRQRIAREGARVVGLRRGGQGLLLVDAHPGVDGGAIAVVAVGAVALVDAREAGSRELGGRELALVEQRGGLDDAEVGGAHPAASARSRAAPSARTRASVPGSPAICRPTGRPSAVVPHGQGEHGLPGDVERHGVGVPLERGAPALGARRSREGWNPAAAPRS